MAMSTPGKFETVDVGVESKKMSTPGKFETVDVGVESKR
jgi:hypothetical protein